MNYCDLVKMGLTFQQLQNLHNPKGKSTGTEVLKA